MNISGNALIICGLLGLAMLSCKETADKQAENGSKEIINEPLLKANQYLQRNEDRRIEAYIARYGLTMAKTATGLRYAITRKSDGQAPQKASVLTISYSVSLLSGETLYSEAELGKQVFEAGKGKVISGLEEGIFLMKEGEKAIFIIPSHLAFGLLGDDKKKTPKETLV